MGKETRANTGKFSRVKEWEILFCTKCGYAIELCERTKDFHHCPLCLREGKETALVKRLNKV